MPFYKKTGKKQIELIKKILETNTKKKEAAEKKIKALLIKLERYIKIVKLLRD